MRFLRQSATDTFLLQETYTKTMAIQDTTNMQFQPRSNA